MHLNGRPVRHMVWCPHGSMLHALYHLASKTKCAFSIRNGNSKSMSGVLAGNVSPGRAATQVTTWCPLK